MEAKNGNPLPSGICPSGFGNYLSGVCLLSVHWLSPPLPTLLSLANGIFQARRCPGTGYTITFLQGLPAAPRTMSPHDYKPRRKGSDGNWAFSTCPCPLIREESISKMPLTNFPLHPIGRTGFYGQWELQRRLESEI